MAFHLPHPGQSDVFYMFDFGLSACNTHENRYAYLCADVPPSGEFRNDEEFVIFYEGIKVPGHSFTLSWVWG